MTRHQRRLVLEQTPRALRPTFTLTEAADLRGLQLLPLAKRARELGRRLDLARAGRRTVDTDDILDQIGQRASVHAEVGDAIAAALRPLADVPFRSVRQHPAVPVDPDLPRLDRPTSPDGGPSARGSAAS
ncbi:MAG: hypothetical protein M3381_09060 [Actinomycetota bacterium]|nr:hypothetical protein [Actinomycetota bacterium]